MTLVLPPNMEALVSAYLRDQPEIIDELEGDDGNVHVYTAIPADAPNKVVRVTQISDTPIGGDPLHLVAFDIQVEAWGSKPEAWRVASKCRALLADRERIVGTHADYAAVVTGSSAGALVDLPDEDFRPAVPRWLFVSTIYAHGVATLTT